MAWTNQRSIHVATIQMDVRPAQTDLRLYRADQLVQDAAELGAELVVLPELFNTGYIYSDDNFHRAEPADGSTVNWLKRTARRCGVHLAGTLLLLENSEIYNAMILAAPDGRTWRYDKSYPWGWERGYFRENRCKGAQRAVVADTDLGRLGMMICWDMAHLELWQYYAGQVDMMVVCSCPPQVTDPTFCFPGGEALSGEQLGSLWVKHKDEGSRVFGAMLDEQARWLGVPVANSVGCGTFESLLPNSSVLLLGLVSRAPSLARYLPRANEMIVRAGMIDACRVVSAEGQTLCHRPQSRGEGFAIAEVRLADQRPQPSGPQPNGRPTWLSYLMSDTFLPRSVMGIYKQGIKRI